MRPPDVSLIDITPPVTSRLAVFPGDTSPTREVLMDMGRGDALTLSTLRTTVHLGAHVDAPSHYGANARTIDQQPLERYIGPCQVMHITAPPRTRLGVDGLSEPVRESRLLLRTDSYPDPNQWTNDFIALQPALVDYLHEQGVRLVGIDTPSVDLADAKELVAHHRFLAHDMAILEGIVLREAPPGRYELIAMPLKLVGFDASPVRAVLRPLRA